MLSHILFDIVNIFLINTSVSLQRFKLIVILCFISYFSSIFIHFHFLLLQIQFSLFLICHFRHNLVDFYKKKRRTAFCPPFSCFRRTHAAGFSSQFSASSVFSEALFCPIRLSSHPSGIPAFCSSSIQASTCSLTLFATVFRGFSARRR